MWCYGCEGICSRPPPNAPGNGHWRGHYGTREGRPVVARKGLPVDAPWGHLGDLSACVAILEIRSPCIYGFRGRKTSPCKGATFGETGSSMASLGSLERGVRSPLGGRFCCGPAMHRWRVHCRCPDYTKPMIWCSPYHSSSTYIDCLAIIGWRVERVLYDTWCYMTNNEVNYNWHVSLILI